MAIRPGVMIYYDRWGPLMQLEDKTLAAILRAAFFYARDGAEPGFTGSEGIFWEIVRAGLDRDGVAYERVSNARRYAAYCRKAKEYGHEPDTYDDWLAKRG